MPSNFLSVSSSHENVKLSVFSGRGGVIKSIPCVKVKMSSVVFARNGPEIVWHTYSPGVACHITGVKATWYDACNV